MKTQPAAYLVEGFDANEKLISHQLFFNREEAARLASVFTEHYPIVRATNLLRSQAIKPWAGITIVEAWDEWDKSDGVGDFTRAIEGKLKERNCVTRRQPLTDEQISDLFEANAGYGRDDFLSFARAVEAAHGIGGEA